MCKIDSLIEQIETNKKIISDKNKELILSRIQKVRTIIRSTLRYLTFSSIEGLASFNLKNSHYNLTYFNNLCNHALFIDSSDCPRIRSYYGDGNKNTYELWLLWNGEFCVTKCSSDEKKKIIREVVDYGECAFSLHDGLFIWNLDKITSLIENSLVNILTKTESTIDILNSELSEP